MNSNKTNRRNFLKTSAVLGASMFLPKSIAMATGSSSDDQRIIVIGEVRNPGIVPILNGTMNLIEVISRSGYLTNNASRTNVQIVRGDLRKPEVRNIDLTDGKSLLTTSLLFQPNDIVYVQARQMDGFNKAFNETVPFFNTTSAILNPFVQVQTLKNGGGVTFNGL